MLPYVFDIFQDIYRKMFTKKVGKANDDIQLFLKYL